MASPLKNKPSFDRETAIQEVVRGRELAARLQSLLGVGTRRELIHGLMEEVSQSFTRALSLLQPTSISKAIQEPASMEDGSDCSVHQGSEQVSGMKVKTSPPVQGIHGRSREHPQSWTNITSVPHHDGHEWRKYGQKKILSSEFPRSYYRCTHRDDQGCLGAKVVQQKDCNDPPMFVVTYIRQHTCKKSLSISQLPVNCSSSEPCMLSFGSDCSTGIKQVQSLLSSFNSTSEAHMGDDVISPEFDTSTSSNCTASPDLTTLMSLDTTGDMLSGICLSPNSDGFDKHLLMDPWNLDEEFGFDDSEFFRCII